MKVSLIQIRMRVEESPEELQSRVFSMMDECRGTDFILLPELWHLGMMSYRTLPDMAQDIHGPLMAAMSAKARELGAYVHCGSFAERRDDRLFNTSVLFDRRGTDIAVYSKIHLFTWYGHEAQAFSRGDKVVCVDTEFGRLGLATCYDLRFGELFRELAVHRGAEMFAVPAAWPTPRPQVLTTLCAARATENLAYLMMCDLTGPYKTLTMQGKSRIVDQWGVMVSDGGETEGIIFGEFDLEVTRKIRHDCPVLADAVMLLDEDFSTAGGRG